MPETCTCGAVLPVDARFCHRCGKPQFEPEILVAPQIQPAEPSPAAPSLSGVSFSNPLALRTSLMVASITTLLEMIPLVSLVAPVLAGYASVSLYQRRTGQTLTARSGAKLGWITAVINAVLFTLWITVQIAIAGPALYASLREQIQRQAPLQQQQFQQILNDPGKFSLFVLFMWIFFFLFSSALHIAGGALGARQRGARRA